jgi:nucleoside-diphosphate-sugar epimerase
MAILITGGTGFLGRHLTRHLLQSGEKDLVVLDAVPNMAAIADVAPQVKVVQGDVMEVTALIDTIKKYKIDGIIHLAYFLGTGGIRNPLPSININCIGTTNILEAARLTEISRVVYMSSVAVYPMRTTVGGPELHEDDPPTPDTVYGACKLFNEHIAIIMPKPTDLIPSGFAPRRSSVWDAGSAGAPNLIISWSPLS